MTVRRTQAVLAAFGVCFASAALGYLHTRASEVYFPWLWPIWMAVTSIACFIFAARLASAFWWNASRIAVVIGLLSRCGSLLTRLANDALENPWSAAGPMALYAAGALAFHRLWTVDFRYWSRRAAGSR